MTAIVRLRVPMLASPRPRSVRVPAGDYRTTGDDLRGYGPPTVRVPEQVAPVDGWRDSHPDHQTVLNVLVQCEPIHAEQE